MSWRIGVDIGGTFTDVAVVNEKDGTIGVTKVSSTPGNFGQAVLTALEQALSKFCLLYTSPSPRDRSISRMPSSA